MQIHQQPPVGGEGRDGKRAPAGDEPKELAATLWVDVTPADARVELLNIEPRYYGGMELRPGIYHLRVSKEGCKSWQKWEELRSGEQVVRVELARSGPEDFVRIPAGSFQMESNEVVNEDDERPVHRVEVKAFWLGKCTGREHAAICFSGRFV